MLFNYSISLHNRTQLNAVSDCIIVLNHFMNTKCLYFIIIYFSKHILIRGFKIRIYSSISVWIILFLFHLFLYFWETLFFISGGKIKKLSNVSATNRNCVLLYHTMYDLRWTLLNYFEYLKNFFNLNWDMVII